MTSVSHCPWCQQIDCWKHCRKAKDGRHVPDPKSGRAADGVNWVIDYNCVHCSLPGSVEIDPSKIAWE